MSAPLPLPLSLAPSPPTVLRMPGAPGHSRDLLAGSARELLASGAAEDPEARYAHAHLAALRAAAAVLAARAKPRTRRSSRVRSAWVLLAEVAPELSEWSAFFAAGAGKRAAAEAGLRGVVSEREADDLLREVETFLALVARVLGVTRQLPLLGDASTTDHASTDASTTDASTTDRADRASAPDRAPAPTHQPGRPGVRPSTRAAVYEPPRTSMLASVTRAS